MKLHSRRLPLFLAVAAAVLFLPGAPTALAEGGDPAPPKEDRRFFPKVLDDALKAMDGADPEDSFRDGLAILARQRFLDGGAEAMRKDAFDRILEKAMASRLEYVTSYCGEILVPLDRARLLTTLEVVVDKEKDRDRLFNAAVLLEECVPLSGVPEAEGVTGPTDLLVELARKGGAALRTRCCEGLGQVADVRLNPSVKARERAVSLLLSTYGNAGKDSDLRNVCATALGKIGDPKAIPSMMSGLRKPDGKHAYFAALALGWIAHSPLTADRETSVYKTLQGMSVPGGGPSLEAYAKAYEASAGEEDIEALLNTMVRGGNRDMREAAAIALGRIVPNLPPPDDEGEPSGDTKEEKDRSAVRADVADQLFDRMVGDKDEYVQWACFHAVSRVGGPWQAGRVLKILKSRKDTTLARALHLAGDFKVKKAAPLLLRGIFSTKNDLMRRRCAIEFWKIAGDKEIAAFSEKVKTVRGGVPLKRGCEALGSWRSPRAFKLAVDVLRGQREGSEEKFYAELALEKMTGHFFGPSAGIWRKWFEKNPNFFSPKQKQIEREKWREEFDEENKGFRQTAATEKAVQMGLEYLARHHDPDGAWDPQRFRERCDLADRCSVSMGTRVYEDPVSRVSLVVLAFMGAGYVPDGGKFKISIRRGMEYLMARQQARGDYLTNDLIGGYNRPICLQAYAEALDLTGDERYRPFVTKGADFLMQIQNKLGGWRYRVRVETSDSSVAAWMLFAMKAAKKSGVRVREIVFEGCRMLFERYSARVPKDGPREDFVDIDPDYGFEVGKDTTYQFHTGYQDRAYAPTHATTALGLMSHILLGYRRSHPFCIGSANHMLDKQMPEVPAKGKMSRLNMNQEYPMYFLYYGTLSMHQMGGRYFRQWNDMLREVLPGTQIKEGCSRGAWLGKNLDGVFGCIYTTCMGVLALETYYRYLPILQD